MRLSEPFETKRMKFRLLHINDIEAIYRQFSDPEMCNYFSEPPCDWEEAKGIIEHYKYPDGKDNLRYGMFDKETDAFIGTCGYHYWDQKLSQVEIGYDIWKDYWKQGYVSEALPELINICYEHLGVDCIYILTHPHNYASMASVSKLGFNVCEPCRNTDEEQVCMKLMRVEWYDKSSF
ncbi:N-acetyltransferase [Paenibacillus anaericanus]|uniref:N-acetyltransferase n=1 Tax=Paenibacillus anaericanus TaxID=170367 RepID=A0A433YEE8_9BACL|nr:GNAT family N-acetyltransferase [Paenibacillus anaericanus]RUT48210.1 N-acetyltransferase [Paenibacillus anaericanus]